MRAPGRFIDVSPLLFPAYTETEARAALEKYATLANLVMDALSLDQAILLLRSASAADGALGAAATFALMKLRARYPL